VKILLFIVLDNVGRDDESISTTLNMTEYETVTVTKFRIAASVASARNGIVSQKQ
jgi:hypothetical protein